MTDTAARRPHIRPLRALVFGLLFVLCASRVFATDTDTLVDAIVAAYGGSEAVGRLSAFRVDAAVTSPLHPLPGKVRRDYRSPDKLRVEIEYTQATEIRVLDGDRGWRGDDKRLDRVEGLPRLAMVYQMLRSAVPETLRRLRHRLEMKGLQDRDGAAYQVLRLDWPAGLELTFWIDPKTFLIAWVEGALQAGSVKTTFATQYRDFRNIDGVWFPFAEENFASGRHTGTTTVRSLTFAPRDLGPFDPTRM